MVTASKKKANLRAKPSSLVQDSVLSKSCRVCALCWAFWKDGRSKIQGQLAHISRDPSDSSEENLAWLCLSCHDVYDSRPSQSKGLQPGELLGHKKRLEAMVEDGALPTYQNAASGALITVEIQTASINYSGLMPVLTIYCVFANQGEKACGIKNTSIRVDGEPAGFLNDQKGSSGPVRCPEYNAGAEFLEFYDQQVLEPGRARHWALQFVLTRPLTFVEGFESGHLPLLKIPVVLKVEPVLGGPITIEVSSLRTAK